MTKRVIYPLLWAGVIIGAALFMSSQGVSDAASWGVIAGLSGAAWGSLNSDLGCGRRCVQ